MITDEETGVEYVKFAQIPLLLGGSARVWN